MKPIQKFGATFPNAKATAHKAPAPAKRPAKSAAAKAKTKRAY